MECVDLALQDIVWDVECHVSAGEPVQRASDYERSFQAPVTHPDLALCKCNIAGHVHPQ